MNICTALYEIPLRSVKKLEAHSLSLSKSHDKKSILDTESLKIVTVLINYKHLHLCCIMQKVITSAHTVDDRYIILLCVCWTVYHCDN